MFITVVRFKLKNDVSLDAATEMYRTFSKAYVETSGLRSKHYIFGDGLGGAVYIWDSRASAERLFTSDWKAMMVSRYGSEPQIEWLENPVTVDNGPTARDK